MPQGWKEEDAELSQLDPCPVHLCPSSPKGINFSQVVLTAKSHRDFEASPGRSHLQVSVVNPSVLHWYKDNFAPFPPGTEEFQVLGFTTCVF